MVRKLSTNGLLEKLVPVLLLASIMLSFVVGMLWQKVSALQNGGVGTAAAPSVANNNQPQNPSGKLTDDQAKKLPEVSSKDHLKGNKNAEVFLVEYSDLQCPFCKQFHPTAQKVVDEYKGKVAWVFRHFPLEQIHPNAVPAAIASECVASLAGEDGFWKFIDAVYAGQESVLTNLSSVAVQVGVNKAKFDTCVAKADRSKVDDQAKLGLDAGVTGTPANFIVNSKGQVWLIPGALPYETLKTTIDEALKS